MGLISYFSHQCGAGYVVQGPGYFHYHRIYSKATQMVPVSPFLTQGQEAAPDGTVGQWTYCDQSWAGLCL